MIVLLIAKAQKELKYPKYGIYNLKRSLDFYGMTKTTVVTIICHSERI